MTNQQPETYSILELFKPVVLLMLAVIVGIVVWSLHNFQWPGFLLYLVVGFFLGSVAGALVRIPLISTWGVMGMMGGLFEGLCQGWHLYGWTGAVLGGLIGIVGGAVIGVLPSMFMCLVMVMCGIDPFVNADAGE